MAAVESEIAVYGASAANVIRAGMNGHSAICRQRGQIYGVHSKEDEKLAAEYSAH
jgi:hypothetical protein